MRRWRRIVIETVEIEQSLKWKTELTLFSIREIGHDTLGIVIAQTSSAAENMSMESHGELRQLKKCTQLAASQGWVSAQMTQKHSSRNAAQRCISQS